MSLYQNPIAHQTRAVSGSGGYPWMYPLFEGINDFLYDADVTKLTWRVNGGPSAPTALGVTVPGGALSYTIGATNNAEVAFQDPGQVYQPKAGTMAELLIHTALPTPTAIGWLFGWLVGQAGTVASAPQNGIVVFSARGSAAVSIRVYKAGVAEQTITTDAVIGTDPVTIALNLNYAANTNELYVSMAVNGRPITLNGSGQSVVLTAAHIPTGNMQVSGGIHQPSSGAASANWRMMAYGTTVSRFYSGGVFGFGDNTGSGSGSGSGTSSGGGLGMDGIGAIE